MTKLSIHHGESLSASGTTSPDHRLSKESWSENALQEIETPLDPHASQGPRWWKRKQTRVDLDSTATQYSVFDDPKTLELYRPPPSYENVHRFDPAARWTWREEKVSIRRSNMVIVDLTRLYRLWYERLTGVSCSGHASCSSVSNWTAQISVSAINGWVHVVLNEDR